MRVTFWSRLPFAREAVAGALGAVPGADTRIVVERGDLLAALDRTDFLVLVDTPPDEARAVVERLREPGNPVRWMHFNSIGREGFDAVGIPAHVAVSHAVGAVAPTVADHAFALMLALRRRLPDALAAQAQERWDTALRHGMRGLDGDTLLVVGLGNIGRAVARRARAFGMRVIAANRTLREDEAADEVHPLAALPELAGKADAIVLCAALTSDTRRLVDAAFLARCRPHAVLVNVGRGGLVDSAALADALHAGRIAGAGLDVTEPEPPPPGHPLFAAPNVILTPHVAGAGPQGEAALAKAAVERVKEAMRARLSKG